MKPFAGNLGSLFPQDPERYPRRENKNLSTLAAIFIYLHQEGWERSLALMFVKCFRSHSMTVRLSPKPQHDSKAVPTLSVLENQPFLSPY